MIEIYFAYLCIILFNTILTLKGEYGIEIGAKVSLKRLNNRIFYRNDSEQTILVWNRFQDQKDRMRCYRLDTLLF